MPKDSPSPAIRLDHLALPVRNAAATYRFYAEILELPLVDAHEGDDWDGKRWLMMIFALADGRRLALCALDGAEPLSTPASELPHFAFAVADDGKLAEWEKRLACADIAYTEERHGSQRSIYFADPSGLVLEITAPPTPSLGERSKDAADLVETWLAANG